MTPQAQSDSTAPKPAPKYIVQASNLREFMLKAAQMLLVDKQYMTVPKYDKNGKETGKYALWNLDDSGKVNTALSAGITLTPDEARTLPTADGCPVIFSSSFALRQLAPIAMLASRISEKEAATALRVAGIIGKASEDVLLAELNKQRIARGEKPIAG